MLGKLTKMKRNKRTANNQKKKKYMYLLYDNNTNGFTNTMEL